MNNINPSQKIYIAHSKTKDAGKGVFAKKNIKKGEIIERCPFIEINENDPANVYGSKLVTYFLYFGKQKDRIAVLLGFGSIYNHSEKPNCKCKVKPKEKAVEFIATKQISSGEEIKFNYKGNSSKDLWFE